MKGKFFAKLKRGLFMTHTEIAEKIGEALKKKGPVSPEDLERIEDALVATDIGPELVAELMLSAEVAGSVAEALQAIKEAIVGILEEAEKLHTPKNASTQPRVTLLVGVNGTGKTTTAAKLAKRKLEDGLSVILAAADTFRAAAIDQLKLWANKVGVEVVAQKEGADPAAVVYDAIAAAKARGVDEVIVDTAGRLHTRLNLMRELEKVIRVCGKQVEGAPHEVLLVLDATVGSNGVEQAKRFGATSGVDGVVLTKLDGTAKGGVAVTIARELKLPVRWVGVGEGVDDLLPFDAHEFVNALFAEV